MLRDAHSRLRLLIAALGCAVLVTSFLSWTFGLRAAATRYTWVKLDPSRAPTAETAELWQVSASCVRPYLVRAALRSKAKLEAHYNAAPPEVRARLDARAHPSHAIEPAAWHPPEGGGQTQAGRGDPYGEYVAALQVKYAEWYAALFKLEIEAGNWQQRLLGVADQTVVLSAATRASFGASSRGGMKLAGSQGDFDGYLLTALGFGGFSSDEQMSLKSACVTINPVMESLQSPSYLGRLWQWPLDCLAEVSFGLELVFISLCFAPIAAWIGTGNLDAGRHLRAFNRRFAASVRDLRQSKLICGARQRFRYTCFAGLALLERAMFEAASRLATITRTTAPDRSGESQWLPDRTGGDAAIKAAARRD